MNAITPPRKAVAAVGKVLSVRGGVAQLQARQRLVRQEEITAEVIELAAGETASRGNLLG